MINVKICGLKREEDVTYVNEAMPTYAGFILNFPKSHRSIDIMTLERLKKQLNSQIQAVGVFVDAPMELVADIADRNLIDLIQLHGQEDELYIQRLRTYTQKKIIKAFKISSEEDVYTAKKSTADYILLDSGQGSGKCFDWKLLDNINREYFLAGGLFAGNLKEAATMLNPYGVDLSSGVETDKIKDRTKIIEVMKIINKLNEEKRR